MSNLEFPSKEAVDDLTLNELFQAITMAGFHVNMSGGGGAMWIVDIHDGKPYYGVCGVDNSPRAALDAACNSWRQKIKESNDE